MSGQASKYQADVQKEQVRVNSDIAKYNAEWRLFEEDYQFYTVNSVSSNKITLNQFVNWEINNRSDDYQSFSLNNISTMNRT